MSGSFNSQYSSYPVAASRFPGLFCPGFSPPVLPGAAAAIAARSATLFPSSARPYKS
jgi:hypothetical protein